MLLRAGTVDVWWAHLDTSVPALTALLSPVERKRFDVYVQGEDRARFLLGCAVSRLALAGYLGLDPADVPLVRICPQCSGAHGKVKVAADGGIEMSVTHGGSLVGVAFCRDSAVGLDVESSDRLLNTDQLAARLLSPAESEALGRIPADRRREALLRYWTRKEAIVKCDGIGLRTALNAVEVSAPDRRAELVSWPSRPELVGRLHLADIDAGVGHLAALAVANAGAVAVTVRSGDQLVGGWSP